MSLFGKVRMSRSEDKSIGDNTEDKRQRNQSAAIFDGRTMQSTPESGERAGYDGNKKKKGSKIHMAVDTLGLLLALHVTPANEQERTQVKELAEQAQDTTGNSVEVAFVDQGTPAISLPKMPKR